MSGGLFGEAAAPAAPKEEERRTKLYGYDSVASQMLEPYGEGALDTLSLEQIWQGTVKGNKRTAYHSHLAADQSSDGWHVGAGISMTSAALLAAIKNFKGEDMKNLIRPDLYEKVLEEVTMLEPVLLALNFGRGSAATRDTGSFREAKKAKLTVSGNVTENSGNMDPLKAAGDFRTWLVKERSPFRSLLFILSGNNSYYSGHTAELVARAAVKVKPMTEQDFIEAVKARMTKPDQTQGSKAASSDGTGLFNA
ncbi:unnamed protein product [Symbiodinium sp. CCMP2592]|nr:unnamed protein product [Symbiodinium sp. CCMP2592]CAE7613991.1 unnamed protein product [Symbiodinium sp. CCMP2592]